MRDVAWLNAMRLRSCQLLMFIFWRLRGWPHNKFIICVDSQLPSEDCVQSVCIVIASSSRSFNHPFAGEARQTIMNHPHRVCRPAHVTCGFCPVMSFGMVLYQRSYVPFHAMRVLSGCDALVCGQIVDGLQRLLEGQLLSGQAFFNEAAGGRFLPELDQVDGGSFFAKSIAFAMDSSCAHEMKDDLVSMMKISGATEEEKTAIEEKYCKHMVQLMCCKAMDSILKVPEAGGTADVKVCLATVEQAVGHMAQLLEAHAALHGRLWQSLGHPRTFVRQYLAVCIRRWHGRLLPQLIPNLKGPMPRL